MDIRKLLVTLLVTVSVSAAADLVTVEEAYEVALSNMMTPVAGAASLIFKECDECDSKRIRMTDNTRFIIDGLTVDLKEFRKQVSRLHDRDNIAVIIMHHLESNTITFVSVSL